MPSNKRNEAPYFRSTEPRRALMEKRKQMSSKSGFSCTKLLSQFDAIAQFLHLHCNSCKTVLFAKLLDFVSKFGVKSRYCAIWWNRGRCHRNWRVQCTQDGINQNQLELSLQKTITFHQDLKVFNIQNQIGSKRNKLKLFTVVNWHVKIPIAAHSNQTFLAYSPQWTQC